VKLYIMRHGPAEDSSASGRDFDRALTASGRDRVRDVARVLVREDEAPLVIVSSPLVRALQTAEIVAAVTKLSERGGTVETRRELSAGGTPHVLVRELVAQKKKRVMIVGHEPDLGTLVAHLSGRVVPLGVQKAMVISLQTPKDDAEAPMRVRFILDPKSLALDPDARSE
jgi:phosphohistidine phosphatase